ncbi:tRNA (guanine(46)-N(7))-methyltransferase TrmB [Slackia sp.]|uniref:tRNA (guanine(46)-N(7))-methyltransferase TrmB n=1 Tax=Slackia sp. TaxID=2049041 RepID=UPI003999E044
MRTARSRMPKSFSLEERLAGCARAVESQPGSWAGSWRRWAPQEEPFAERAFRERPYERVCLDLGCGKGEYTVACAKANPDVLFIGLDIEGVCVMRGAERALAEGVSNAVFVFEEDPDLDLSTVFAPGELDAILLNFSTPFPKKKKAPLRLTYVDRLMAYRAVLAEGGMVRLRTDSQPLRDFSLTQLELAGYEVRWCTDDVRAMFPEEPWSGYENKLVAQGATVYGFEATPRIPGPDPESIVQTAPLSLVSYLPEDIENLEYVPHGMQGCVENMRGRRANRRAKGLPEWTRPII